MIIQEALVRDSLATDGAVAGPLGGSLARRIGRAAVGTLVVTLTALSILLAGVSGCATTNGGHGRSGLWQPFSNGAESKRERESLRKAVEKDPFPRAKSSPVDVEG